MKRILLSIVYTLIAILVGIILYLEISSTITSKLYGYEKENYSDEMDFIFNPKILNYITVEEFYKSGEKGSLSFIHIDTLSKIAVIESSNFQEILLDDVQPESIDKIKQTQNKSYFTFVKNHYPLINQALNPRESTYLNILFQEPYQIDEEIQRENFHYFRGNFQHGAFSNSQHCSMISFRGNEDNELLILKHEGKLYFIMQTASNISLLEIVNPAL